MSKPRLYLVACVAALSLPRAGFAHQAEIPWDAALLAALHGHPVGRAMQDFLARLHATARLHAGTTAPAPPTIISGRILTPKITIGTVPAAPGLSFKYAAPGVYNYDDFIFTSPSGQSYYTSYGFPPPVATAGTIANADIAAPLSIYAEPGTWTLTYAQIADLAGQSTSYDASQLAAIFPSVTMQVVNPISPDITPPTVSAGKILTPTVSLSGSAPFFRVQLKVADDISGALYSNVFLLDSNGGSASGSGNNAPAPVLSGTLVTGVTLNPGEPTGTWTITGYQVCDVPGNCLTDTNHADVQALFGTTSFQVTP